MAKALAVFGPGKTALTCLTFSCRAHEEDLQIQGQVILHADRLCKVFPGSRTSLLQQVKEQGGFLPGVGDASQALQGPLGDEALGSGEEPVGTVAEELHELGAGSGHSCLQVWIVLLEWGLGG